jgi:hypothetical protein
VTDVRHVLVLPDRDTAESVADLLTTRFPLPEPPRLLRDALAGEDDAEDAQWLLILEDPAAVLDPTALDAVAADHDGWLEREPS